MWESLNNDEPHYLLLIANNYATKSIVKRTNKLGLMPGQPKILEFLSAHNGCTQKEIGLGCALDKSTITFLLSGMEKQDLIRKVSHASDKRSYLIHLTEKGEKTAAEVKDIFHAVDNAAWKNTDASDKTAFIKMLKRIIENLKTESDKP